MPRKPCFWTRKLELELVEFVRRREYIWRPFGNTNHHIQQKYKAYAEFAARLGCGFTARSVRDRWVNIRSTFNHNLRKVDKSKETAKCPQDIYTPCWPLWKPLQFLRHVPKKEDTNYDNYTSFPEQIEVDVSRNSDVKMEYQTEDDETNLGIRERGQRTNRPRTKPRAKKQSTNKTKCKQVIDELLQAMEPLSAEPAQDQTYWFFSKYVVGRLNNMRPEDAECASHEIWKLLRDEDPT
ncbi:uncharacterized protein LOC142980427 [Anticarsia gemmatalis]|uniref:uncharacterized protein LOC142980427 n=1 Tax=Anticarsia gemmatalis TaxID=129554 RepID=UPI003F7637FD